MEILKEVTFSDRVICNVRQIPLTEALDRIGAAWHIDNTFRPRKDPKTRLVLIKNQEKHIEMLATEPLFFLRQRGSRDRVGQGWGAIDLVMALTRCSFPEAVRLLLTGENDEKP